MNELNDQDWDLINAYHDRELGAAAARDLEARIASEPTLALALKDVRSAASSLAVLRPDIAQTATLPRHKAANKNWRLGKWLAGGAAAVALAIALGSYVFAKRTVLDIHADLAGQNFSVSDENLHPVFAMGDDGLPDLAGANLTPVAVRQLDVGWVAHYAGRNGCRLSYFRDALGYDGAGLGSDRQVEFWTTADNHRHMIVASGMDPSKFDAIATYLKHATRQKSSESILAAVSEATTAATPCVG